VAASDFDFALTRAEICESALRKVGALALGQPPEAEDVEVATEALNLLIKEWENEGVFIWQFQTCVLSFPAGTIAQSLDSTFPIMGIDAATWSLTDGSSDTDAPLEVVSYRDFLKIEDKRVIGTPEKVTLNLYGPNQGSVNLWPIPDKDVDVTFTGVEPSKDWDLAGSSSRQMGSNWLLALVYGVADLLGDDYGTDAGRQARIADKAGYYFKKAKASDISDRSDRKVVKGAY
jgi:hypothetical protein